jgi:hypothetical protein
MDPAGAVFAKAPLATHQMAHSPATPIKASGLDLKSV